MAKKKAVEPPTIDTTALVEELQKKRLEATAQEQIAIDQQLLEITKNEEK